jgi:hypothetical protein
LSEPVTQAWKKTEHFLDSLRQIAGLAGGECSKQKILLDRHIRKDLTSFGNMGDAKGRDFMRRKCRQIGRAKAHDSARPWNKSRDRTQDRAFARRVRPDDADELAL